MGTATMIATNPSHSFMAVMMIGLMAILLSSSSTIIVNAQDQEPSNSNCPTCFDRYMVKIGVATHATSTDVFWTAPISATIQASNDLGISLDLLPSASGDESEQDIESSMTDFINSFCASDNVGGLVTTLPSDNTDLMAAVQQCLDNGIPVIVFNAGQNLIESFTGPLLHYIGQNEYDAGRLAGLTMVENCPADTNCTFYCANHAPTVNVVIDRCDGFADGVSEAGGTFVESIDVDANNFTLYQEQVEASIGIDGEWTGIGLLLAGQANHEPGLQVQSSHTGLQLGAIDVSDALYAALSDNRIEFGIDQQSYLQGSLPLPLLTWNAQLGQNLHQQNIDTRSGLITTPPSNECTVYEACNVGAPTPSPDPSTMMPSSSYTGSPQHWSMNVPTALLIVPFLSLLSTL